MIASFRKGTLPANLQGTWNMNRSAPWTGGYWANINVQMNYWPAFVTGLEDTFGIAEMLLQSHNREIELLPALPKAWPTGRVAGLRARGGFTVNFEWKNGKVTSYRIAGTTKQQVEVRVNGERKTTSTEAL
jgi:hypothetical protein